MNGMQINTVTVIQFGAEPDKEGIQTGAFQKAIDYVWQQGGGEVQVPCGKYTIGSIRLRTHVTLHLLKNAQLYGTRNPEDYMGIHADILEPVPDAMKTDKYWEPFVKGVKRCYDFMKPGSRWSGGLIRALNAENIRITAEPGAVIDGQDCYDENGEEGYRGPHGISMHHCRNIVLEGYTIRNTGNWAHCITDCDNILMQQVTVLAGHDGIHCTSCHDIVVRNSQFYTGDDCVAGFANVNMLVEGCTCNTACSGMRLGGTNVLVRNCTFYGPARYFFRGSLTLSEKKSGVIASGEVIETKGQYHRTNMLSVFTYYADFSVDIHEQPGNIIVRDCTARNVDRFLHYNYSGNERWQSHRPLESITFENITAEDIGMPLTAYGSADVPLLMTLRNVKVLFREGVQGITFMHAANYDRILLDNVEILNDPSSPLIKSWTQGGSIIMRNVVSKTPDERKIVYTDEPFVCRTI